MPRVGIALGSNLGDRLKNIQTARDWLSAISLSGEPVLQASIYQTEPVNCPPGSPDFYNTVIEVFYDGSPFELLELTQTFQRRLGRVEVSERNAPRTIDIDLIYFGDEKVSTETLELPHPRFRERGFVTQPLSEIRPDLGPFSAGEPLVKVLADW